MAELLFPTLDYKLCGEKDHVYFPLTTGYLLPGSLFNKYELNAEWIDRVENVISGYLRFIDGKIGAQRW